ncbi:peptide chain release factor N(5)-glutamine methyltransferase [candidate division KSB1 bacterium]
MSPENPRPTSSPLPLKEILDKAAVYLQQKNIADPRLNAERLLGAVLKLARIELYTNFERPVVDSELRQFRESLKRRAAREPLDYVIGWTEFYGLQLHTDPRALVPRPETEQLVESTLEILGWGKAAPPGTRIIEIGTGCGAISITLAAQLPEARILATDISSDSLELAARNAELNHLRKRITFLEGDLFQPVDRSLIGAANLIISNPPYVAEPEFQKLPPEIREYEPRNALVGGVDGLEVIERLINQAPPFLAEGALLALEIGHDQADRVRDLTAGNGAYGSMEIRKDYAGHDRMFFANKEG